MRVLVRVEDGPFRGVNARSVASRVRAMGDCLQLGDVELSVVLTSDERIRILNRDYRRKDRPTDVLAFPMREGELGGVSGEILGDVIVSVPRAREQARDRSVDLKAELTMLLAHGLLHLLGWDHVTAAQDLRMRKETERLCRAANQKPRTLGT